jgi:hypothetical protein
LSDIVEIKETRDVKMKLRRLFIVIMGVALAAALLPAFMSVPDAAFAQISPLATDTRTPVPSGPTDTPVPPTPTDTPVPPTPTDTPVPPTDTPPPPTNTPTPIPLPPTLGSFSIYPLEGVAQVDTALDFTGIFTDPGLSINLGFATFAWGDGYTSTCPPDDTTVCWIDLGVGSVDQVTSSSTFTVGEVKGRHVYSEPGVYAVQLTLRDEFGQSDTSTFEFVTVYDPSGGFVTGGGWIWSEPGWCQLDDVCAGAEGKANFGFVSKYKKGASVPTGNTEFQFKAGNLNFRSNDYDWLVVNQGGTNAQFKGEGAINGAVAPSGENYQFMIWATDGSPDTFRIKIWYEDSSGPVIVYDNGFDQSIGGGSIVVHKPKSAK